MNDFKLTVPDLYNFFAKNCMKMKEFGSEWVGVPGALLYLSANH